MMMTDTPRPPKSGSPIDQPGQTRDRYATIGSAFLAKVARRLQSIDPDDLSAADLARWTDIALKLEQAGRPRHPYNAAARRLADLRPDEFLLDPDCRDGKHQSCIGSPCACQCHVEAVTP